MDINVGGCPTGYREGFKELLRERGYSGERGIRLTLREAGEPLIQVSYENQEAVLEAPAGVYFYRALMTLTRLLEKSGIESAFKLTEKVNFRGNGIMLDCSRNSVWKVESVKAWIRIQACLGMKTLMLYTEDTYEVPKYPYFGAFRGRYRKDELQEMDEYALRYGIEMVPCIQTLGHLKRPLRWEAMKELRDTEDILMVGDEKVYDFIRACLVQIRDCFRTSRIHLGMDEAWTLGLGKYLFRNGYHTKQEIMRGHLQRVDAICKELGMEPMIWSDMYFRMNSENEEYYDLPGNMDLSEAVKPPAGMTLVYWDYYHLEEQFYRDYIRMHRQLSDKLLVAGGGWSWNGMVPNLKTAFGVTRAAMNACINENVEDVIYTLWGDDGSETPVLAALPAVILCAEYGFGNEPPEQRVKEQFEFLTGYSYETFMALGDFDIHSGEVVSQGIEANPSKNLFYQDLLMGLYDGQMEDERIGKYYGELEDRLMTEKCFGGFNSLTGRIEKILRYYRAFAGALSIKADLGLRLKESYDKNDREQLFDICSKEIPEAQRRIRRCAALREEIWMEESRVFGWEVLDMRFAALTGRMESAARRISAYLDKTVENLPELEEERLHLHPDYRGERKNLPGSNIWMHMVSASPLGF